MATSLQTKVNIQKAVGAIGIGVTVLSAAIAGMNPIAAFYLLAGSNALNAGLQYYFGATNPDVNPPTTPATPPPSKLQALRRLLPF